MRSIARVEEGTEHGVESEHDNTATTFGTVSIGVGGDGLGVET